MVYRLTTENGFFAWMKLVFTAHIIFDNAFIEEEPNEYVKRLENIIEK